MRSLSVSADPQDDNGAEPGDLTKRMAIPWQADFFDCTAETPNITNPAINESLAHDGIQVPPVYYVYWWPPQAPMQVIAGSLDPGEQVLDGYVTYPLTARPDQNGNLQVSAAFQVAAAGQQLAYQRGINSFSQMIASWKDLGFIVNQGGTRCWRLSGGAD
jgi:L-lysine 6-oxidase